jgi:hypothetical protein
VAPLVICFLLGATATLLTAFVVVVSRPGPTIASVDARTLQSSVPTLTAAQVQSATDVARGDPTIAAILAGRSAASKNVVVWTTEKGALLGGVVTLDLAQAATLSGTWIDLDYDCSETASPPYGSVRFGATVQNVTSLTVFVDLTRHKVAGFMPTPHTNYTFVGLTQYPTNVHRLSDSCRG